MDLYLQRYYKKAKLKSKAFFGIQKVGICLFLRTIWQTLPNVSHFTTDYIVKKGNFL